MKPVLCLDVDGVVNACPWDGNFPATHPEETWNKVDCYANGMAWPIRYSTVVIDRLNEFSERVEIRWLTTWKHDALALGAKLGLNEFPVQTDSVPQRMGDWWKMGHAAHVLTVEKRPLIWVDDDLGSGSIGHATKLAKDVPVKLITPETSSGLKLKELDEIELFILSLTD